MKPKYIFFGTPEFAAIILEKLIAAGMPPLAVVCNPDCPAGRKKIITPPPVKILAQKYDIRVWQPEKLEIGNCLPAGRHGKLEIEKLDDIAFAVVAAYAKIVPKEILNSLPAKFLGVHPSLLPKYRGSTPIQTAILNGEKETGVTIYILDEKIDHGPILAQREFPIFDFQFSILQQKLADLSGDLLIETIPKFLKSEIKPRPQNEAEATRTKKFAAEDAYVKPEDLEVARAGENIAKAEEIWRKIRALNPEPGVWTIKDGLRLKLLDARIADNKLKLEKLQWEGKKPQTV